VLNVNGGTLITTNYTQSGGVFDGAGTFSASTGYNVTGGTQTGTGATVLAPGFTYTPGTTTLGRSLIVQGTLNENAGDTLTVAAGRTLTVNGILNNAGTITGAGDIITAASRVLNLTGGTLSGTGATTANGVVNVNGGATLSRNVVSNNAFNLGSRTLNVNGGTLDVRQFGGFISPPGATFQVVRAGTVNGTFANTNIPLIFSVLSTNYKSQFVELGDAALTTASMLAQIDPAIVKQDKELVTALKKLVGKTRLKTR
jgi:fibronectin-binding autotransporter adhesin